jgi:hypothetical protein
MTKTVLAVAALLALATPAFAGSNSCRGDVTADKDWVYVTDYTNEIGGRYDPATKKSLVFQRPPEPCRAKIGSSIAHRILAKCPVGSVCWIDMPDDNKSTGHPFTKINSVERLGAVAEERVPNMAVIRKLCPDPKARCLARDNPGFYKDEDPEFYNRITKQK